MTKIVAVTNCPAGIAHTYMVAEKIEDEAKKRDYNERIPAGYQVCRYIGLPDFSPQKDCF